MHFLTVVIIPYWGAQQADDTRTKENIPAWLTFSLFSEQKITPPQVRSLILQGKEPSEFVLLEG